MYKIGLVGDTGMVGQEIEKLIKKHDKVDIIYRKNSKREEGKRSDCDVIFLATKDKESMVFASDALKGGARIIDMSGAFRLTPELFEQWYKIKHEAIELFEDAVYGMPAFNRDKIAKARLVANPGCYATSVILALAPLKDILKNEVSIVSTSGNSGARREIDSVSNEVSYSFGRNHKHVPEMEMYSGFKVDFTPIVLRSVFKGINTNIRGEVRGIFQERSSEELIELIESTLKNAYSHDDYVFVVRDSADKSYGTADVNDTHKMLVKVNVDGGKVYINSLIDNLMKGAASQGIENMNIMLGLPRLYSIEENIYSMEEA